MLVQTLTRHSLLSMLRAQSAMLSVYQQHTICVPETWGLTRCVDAATEDAILHDMNCQC